MKRLVLWILAILLILAIGYFMFWLPLKEMAGPDLLPEASLSESTPSSGNQVLATPSPTIPAQPTELVVFQVTIVASKLNIRPCTDLNNPMCVPMGYFSGGDQVDVSGVKNEPDWYLIVSGRWFHEYIWVGCTDRNPQNFSCESTR